MYLKRHAAIRTDEKEAFREAFSKAGHLRYMQELTITALKV